MESKYPIENAIHVINMVKHIGYEGLEAFTLTREKPSILMNEQDEDETYEEFIERLATVCWMGADYFKMWLGDENKVLTKHILHKLSELTDGVYYMNFEGEESHFWVWIINGNEVWYAGTYGGVCDISVKRFDKRDYFAKILRALNGSIEDYNYIFQVNADISKVGYKYIKYSKSDKY